MGSVMAGLLGDDRPLFFGDMAPGQWGSPAELYAAYVKAGLSPQEARERVMKSLRAPTGSNAGQSDYQIENFWRRTPMS